MVSPLQMVGGFRNKGMISQLSPTYAIGSTSEWVCVTADGLYVYASNYITHTINGFSRDPATGALTSLGTATPTAANPLGMALSTDNLFLYCACYIGTTHGSIGQFSRSPTTGKLTFISNVATLDGPTGLVVSPDGLHAYVFNVRENGFGAAKISQYSIASGLLTALSPATVNAGVVVTPAGNQASHIAISPDGLKIYGVCRFDNYIAQFNRNASTGLLTPMSTATVATGTGPENMAITPNGLYAYVVNGGTDNISQYSITGGLLSPLSPATIACANQPGFLKVNSDGDVLYVSHIFDDKISLFHIGAGGLLSAFSPAIVTSAGGPTGMDISPDKRHLYVCGYSGNILSAYKIY